MIDSYRHLDFVLWSKDAIKCKNFNVVLCSLVTREDNRRNVQFSKGEPKHKMTNDILDWFIIYPSITTAFWSFKVEFDFFGADILLDVHGLRTIALVVFWVAISRF
jgi:hypothetical protein